MIDVAGFLAGEPDARRQVVDAVAAACREVGFLVVSGHGLPSVVLERAFTRSREFFALPQAAKNRWRPQGPARQRGYHALATRGLAYTLGEVTPPDLRESLFLGPVEDHRAAYAEVPAARTAYWPNTIPSEPPDLAAALLAVYRAFERVAADLLRIFALALSMPEDHFADKMDRHFSILACHHYPPLAAPPRPGQLRTGAHTDFGAMTLLAMDGAVGGLQARVASGEWVPVRAGPGELVVNLGDMMARWTNERWRSTLHRVVNPEQPEDAASRRQSIGFFVHPNFDTRVECFASCLDPGQAPRYPAITAGDHITAKIARSHSPEAG